MKLRERINEIKKLKGVLLRIESEVNEYVVKPYMQFDEDILTQEVKVQVLADFHFLRIIVGNKVTFDERMDDVEAAIAEMKAYQEYFENEDYKTEKIESNGIVGFYVIL